MERIPLHEIGLTPGFTYLISHKEFRLDQISSITVTDTIWQIITPATKIT